MPGTAFKDHFSGHATDYAAARPRYPAEMYAWLAALAPGRERAWDAGTGNGQSAVALAAHFDSVIATEPSSAQLANAEPHPRVDYRCEAAESPSLAPASVDLLTVAQALHWFDVDAFWRAARPVLREQALVAVWSYQLSSVTPEVDRVFLYLYEAILGPWWPPERAHVIDGYARLPFPFARIEAPPFSMECAWRLDDYLAYLRSWSASARYHKAQGEDPVALVAEAMAEAWGDPDTVRSVRWPLMLRVGRAA